MNRGSCLIFESGEVIDKGGVELYQTRLRKGGGEIGKSGVMNWDA